PMRTGGLRPSGRTRALPVPRDKERLHMPGSSTTPGHMGTRAFAPIRVAFHNADGVGSRDSTLSRLIGLPMHSPADASPTPSRHPAHGSGPMRFATPSSWRTFTTYSLPVSPAHRREFIVLLGGAATWPPVVCAQQRERRVGVLMEYDEKDAVAKSFLSGFTQT